MSVRLHLPNMQRRKRGGSAFAWTCCCTVWRCGEEARPPLLQQPEVAPGGPAAPAVQQGATLPTDRATLANHCWGSFCVGGVKALPTQDLRE